MSAGPASKRVSWRKAAVILGAVAIGAGIGIGIAVAEDSDGPSAKAAQADPGTFWAAGDSKAPDFTLRDQSGGPISLHGLRGRPVVITFIDPVCRSHCPLEAKVLNDASTRLPAGSKPTIVAVSVNPWSQSRAILRQDAEKWKLVPQWRWALGDHGALAQVWRQYAIGVQVRTKTLGGVTVHDVGHTEGAYVVDRDGWKRALFLWPYRAEDLAAAVQRADS